MEIGVSERGRNGRKTSEDRHLVSRGGCLVCVFDGHGGSHVSDFVCSNFARHFEQALTTSMDASLRATFASLDEAMADYDRVYHRMAGTTATCAYLDEARKQLWVANVGDSQACLIGPQGIKVLTVEHNCRANVEEVNRIKQCGGRVVDNRVDRILAVTRAIGDADFRDSGVVPDPHIMSVDDLSGYTHLVLATDGLWDVCSFEQARRIISDNADMPAAHLSDLLLQYTIRMRSMDDVTILVVKL